MRRCHVTGLGAMVVGLLAGLIGGNAAVSELQQPADESASAVVGRRRGAGLQGATADPAIRRALAYEMADVDCADCSDYDLGYRSAAQRGLRSTAECMNYSWSYQRGCLAYLRRS